MRKVQCYECGKRYDFDVDDFCPKCGAFTQPARASRIDLSGAVVRVDGINEQNHRNSFLHQELHDENKERKGTVLEGKKKKVYTGERLRPPKNSRGVDFALHAVSGALDLITDFMDS